jgi:ABC-type Fe3+-hydroxamate transport system substrate-binding protein
MIGGMWMPELIEMAGGTPVVTRPGDHAPTLTMDALRELSPDVVVVSPCGFPLDRTREELPQLRGALPWESWPAVRAGRVYVADGNAYFNRPGPRIVESLDRRVTRDPGGPSAPRRVPGVPPQASVHGDPSGCGAEATVVVAASQ